MDNNVNNATRVEYYSTREGDNMVNAINQAEWSTRDANMVAGCVISKLQYSYQCKVEKWTTEGNILLDGKDTGINNVPATVLFNILEGMGYRVKFEVMPEHYPICVAK